MSTSIHHRYSSAPRNTPADTATKLDCSPYRPHHSPQPHTPSGMMKPAPHGKDRFLRLLVAILGAAIAVLAIALNSALSSQQPTQQLPDLTPITTRLERIEETVRQVPAPQTPHVTVPGQKNLLFYNRPPKTGSTTIRIAMKKVLEQKGMSSAHCFNMIEWNEMVIKTIINRREIDFYGCHTRLTNSRHAIVSQMRGGNVTFMTSTRDPENLILSAYLQQERERNIADITDDNLIAQEVEKYKAFVETYPVDALYKYHGADIPLRTCPVEFAHEDAMRRVAERYEIVIDLTRPEESSIMVEAVTGLRPDFSKFYNKRSINTAGKMLAALKAIDTSHKTCGNELVHKVFKMQFNMIKDRMLQNRCFTEETADFKLCEYATLKLDDMIERTRNESYDQRILLERAAAADAAKQA